MALRRFSALLDSVQKSLEIQDLPEEGGFFRPMAGDPRPDLLTDALSLPSSATQGTRQPE